MRKQLLRTSGFTALFFISALHWVNAQSLEIDFIEFVGRNVVVHYSLDDGANSTRQFLVQLYSSQDNFTTPLTRVTGDYGSEVTAGFDKKIVWDVTQELGSYSGTLSLELRGRVYVPFVKLKDFKEDQVFKRGKNYPLNWTSGNLSGQLNIELFNAAGERIWGENNVANVGKFDWYLEGNVKKGSNYKLKFTNAKDRNDIVFSPAFTVKRKIPLVVKIGGVVAAAALVKFAIPASDKTSPGESGAASYPDPISPK